MDEIKKINNDAINNISGETGFNQKMLLKDYYITVILYLIKDVRGIYFKGGTALQKIFLNYSRLSEDIDFTLSKNLNQVKKEIISILKKSKLFEKITKDKDVDGFTRLIAHFKGFSNEDGVVFIDLNKRAKLMKKPEIYEMKHFYGEFIPKFSFKTVSKEEMMAGKMAAAIGRNQPRDHYDLYKIIKSNIPINLEMVRKKCEQSNHDFSIIKMFNKAKKLNNRWEEDLLPLLAQEISFQEVIKTLSKHFNLKQEKENLQDKDKK